MGFVLKVGDTDKFPKAPEDWPRCGSFNYKKASVNNNSKNSVFNNSFIALTDSAGRL